MKRFLLSMLLVVTAMTAVAQSRAERILREIRNPQSNYTVVISHRGDWRNFPENSLEAIDSAIRMGVDVVEIDVQRTSDGVLVICHDRTINRTTTGKGKISDLTYDEICQYCLRSGHGVKMPKFHMPTLEQMLDLCRDRAMINIDKGYEYYDEILPMLESRNMVEQVIIKGKKSPATVLAKLASHEKNMIFMPIINFNTKSWDTHAALFEEWMQKDALPLAVELCWDGTLKGEKRLFDRVVKSGARLWINTLWDSLCGGQENGLEDDRALKDTDAIYGKVLSLGATMIQTDRPAMLIEYLTAHGRHTLE